MGCAVSACRVVGSKKKKRVHESAVFVPSLRVPIRSDLQKPLKGPLPKILIERLSNLRNRIALIAENFAPYLSDESTIEELRGALEEYLSLLVGLIKKETKAQGSLEFKWKNLEDGKQKTTCTTNIWFEILSVVHMMAVLTLSEANCLMIPKDRSSSDAPVVSSDCRRAAVDLLLKASGYFDFCLRQILVRIPQNIKKKLPSDLQEGVIEALSIQALGQGTEIQLGLAVESKKATLPVMRRMACELVLYFSEAYKSLSGCDVSQGSPKKLLRFIHWKILESKAAAYFFHGLFREKGKEPGNRITAVSCFIAAAENLAKSKKACLIFCLAPPVTRKVTPLQGALKHLHQMILEAAVKRSQTHKIDLNDLRPLPDLPEFQLSLTPEQFELPRFDPSEWHNEKSGQRELVYALSELIPVARMISISE